MLRSSSRPGSVSRGPLTAASGVASRSTPLDRRATSSSAHADTRRAARRSPALAGATALALAALPLVPLAHTQANDSWSAEVPLIETGTVDNHFAGIHATLLPDESVMLFGFTQTVVAPTNVCAGRTGTDTALFDPNSPIVNGAYRYTRIAESTDISSAPNYCPGENACGPMDCEHDTFFCSGHTLLADGSLITVGGLRVVNRSDPVASAGGGLRYGSIWNGSWTRIAGDFKGMPPGDKYINGTFFTGTERYYPTAMRMIDGRVLILSGSQILGASAFPGIPGTGPITNLSAEFYDPDGPTGNQYTALANTPPPEIFNSDYTHSFVLPKKVQGYDTIMIGWDGQPVFLDTVTETWSAAQAARPGPAIATPNKGASTLMLPIRLNNGQWGYANGSILTTGGQPNPGKAPGAGHYADLYDVASGLGAWDQPDRIELNIDRHHPATVLLPNGEIAVIGGHVPGQSTGAIQLSAEYINLRGDAYTVTLGNDSPGVISRGYHTSAVLLPDGRVMVTAGRRGGNNSSPIERATVQFLSPPYMSAAERPIITQYPDEITAGSNQTYVFQATGSISEVVLVALGSMTHSVDFNQRHVQLKTISVLPVRGLTPAPMITQFIGAIQAPSKRKAPPGYYMIFALASGPQKVPSVGKIIQVK